MSAPPEFRIHCKGITKYYKRSKVLDDITIGVREGHMLGLIGPGGAGKSLLVKIICGLVEPDAGQVFIDGQELTAMGEAQLQEIRKHIGMVFQNYALFDFMNVGENIALPLRMMRELGEEEIQSKVAEMLEKVALPGIQHKLPNELSGGMKKRVSFARAVVRNPPIIIYDDPTAGLDPVTSAKIFQLLIDRQNAGCTSVTISHDIGGLQPLCDEWAMINNGRIIFHGTTEAIEACDDRYVRAFWKGRGVRVGSATS